MDPEQSAPIGAILSRSTLFSIEASYTFQQTIKQTTFVAIGTLRVNLGYILHKLHKINPTTDNVSK